MPNEFLTELLGSESPEAAEAVMQDAFVKQASAEGIDLSKLADEEVNHLYEGVFKPAMAAEMQKQASAQVTSDSIIEKVAAAGASDEILEKLAFAKLCGEAQFEGWRERWEREMAKWAQEAEGGAPPEAEGTETPAAPPESAPAEGAAPVEAAKEIVESATEEAVELVAKDAPPETPPEALAQAAAEKVPEIVEAKTAALIEYIEKNAEDKVAAGKFVAGLKKALGHPATTHAGAALGGAGLALGARALIKRMRKDKGKEKKAEAVALLQNAISKEAEGGFLSKLKGIATHKATTHAGAALGGAGLALGARALLKRRAEKKEKAKKAALILKSAMQLD